ncbi:MAG: DUF1549 domain-containing protein [Verrucomicrobiae bacterium]|nr:DUF1549 domain-containing protein [Verrucomicrobiae bacterium]
MTRAQSMCEWPWMKRPGCHVIMLAIALKWLPRISFADEATGGSRAHLWATEPLPKATKSQGANPIDTELAHAHCEAGIVAASRTDRQTRLRRLSFDLIGLPPTLESRRPSQRTRHQKRMKSR